jgi:hypothetical protein
MDEKRQHWDIIVNGEYKLTIPYSTKHEALLKYVHYKPNNALITDEIEAVEGTRGYIVSCWCQFECMGHKL